MTETMQLSPAPPAPPAADAAVRPAAVPRATFEQVCPEIVSTSRGWSLDWRTRFFSEALSGAIAARLASAEQLLAEARGEVLAGETVAAWRAARDRVTAHGAEVAEAAARETALRQQVDAALAVAGDFGPVETEWQAAADRHRLLQQRTGPLEKAEAAARAAAERELGTAIREQRERLSQIFGRRVAQARGDLADAAGGPVAALAIVQTAEAELSRLFRRPVDCELE